jgi:hypothetical protein
MQHRSLSLVVAAAVALLAVPAVPAFADGPEGYESDDTDRGAMKRDAERDSTKAGKRVVVDAPTERKGTAEPLESATRDSSVPADVPVPTEAATLLPPSQLIPGHSGAIGSTEWQPLATAAPERASIPIVDPLSIGADGAAATWDGTSLALERLAAARPAGLPMTQLDQVIPAGAGNMGLADAAVGSLLSLSCLALAGVFGSRWLTARRR